MLRIAGVILRRHLDRLLVRAAIGVSVDPVNPNELGGLKHAIEHGHGVADRLQRIEIAIAIVDLAGRDDLRGISGAAFDRALARRQV